MAATLIQLTECRTDPDLRLKVEGAIYVEAIDIMTDQSAPPDYAQQLAWANQACTDPVSMAMRMLPAIIGANADLDKADILGLDEAIIKSNVAGAVKAFQPPA